MYEVIGLVFCLMVLVNADVERKQVKNGLITERIGETRILKAEWTVAIAIHAPEVPPMTAATPTQPQGAQHVN